MNCAKEKFNIEATREDHLCQIVYANNSKYCMQLEQIERCYIAKKKNISYFPLVLLLFYFTKSTFLGYLWFFSKGYEKLKLLEKLSLPNVCMAGKLKMLSKFE